MKTIGILLASNIKRFRKIRGMTQNDLAVVSGISFRGIQDIESGGKSPRKSTIAAIAGALGVSEFDLYKEPQSEIKEEIDFKKTTTPGDMSDEELERIISKVISKTESLKKGDRAPPQTSEEKLRQELISYITSSLVGIDANNLTSLRNHVDRILSKSRVNKKAKDF